MKSANDIGLKKIIDLTRWISVALLLLHFYFFCYGAFREWHFTTDVTERILGNIAASGLFSSLNKTKLFSLLFLGISLLGAQGRKSEKIGYRTGLAYLLSGLLTYFISALLFLTDLQATVVAVFYMSLTGLGYILVLTGGTLLTRIIKLKLKGDVFNKGNQTFPQEEKNWENKYSFNFPARYNLKGKIRSSFVSIVNPFRNLLLLGLPGSGKTLWGVKEILRQAIFKGYAICLHDFKPRDLTDFTYSYYLLYKHKYKVEPQFFVLCFDEIYHRCNPLMVKSMDDISDAASASRSILLGLNQDMIDKQGEFWTESSINFVTCLIWFLRLYKDGIYCTLPHVIEFAQTDLRMLLTILRAEPQLEALVKPFVSALEEDAGKQLVGQISGATVSLGTLSTPNLYYVLSADDFTMTINDPKAPKIVCLVNNPMKANIYSPVFSLYLNNLQKLLREQDEQPSLIMLEEFATLSWPGLSKFLGYARSYLVAVVMVLQDAAQLIANYGQKQANVIMSMAGNLISGQVTGQSAKDLADRFGKIMQDRESVAINSSDTSVTHSKQLDYAIPQSVISSLSAGEFVGVVADNPDQKIEHKMFHSEFILDEKRIKKSMPAYKNPPKPTVDNKTILEVFAKIKKDIRNLVADERERILSTPELKALIIPDKK
ncbi:YWFCY domain-containing protein [Filimonas effusa]|uniref:Conjugal transfer protein TraG n=1 Tax=Filimonas effusa TaxID=2508721 RepID=A0A4Q1DC54_9BACT|nr:YWFCY domain-containing protein [Filimonas effusa]RXK87022.1 conjugal transfer protein TraG [Filimonas effusa]